MRQGGGSLEKERRRNSSRPGEWESKLQVAGEGGKLKVSIMERGWHETWFYALLQPQPEAAVQVRQRQGAGLIQELGFPKWPWQRERKKGVMGLYKASMMGLGSKTG